MKKLVIAFAVLALFAGMASAKLATDYATEFRGPNRANTLYGYFTMDDVTGFMTFDNTATAVPHFHVDTYIPNTIDPTSVYHWWCGNFDYDADGGYGNGWNDLLTIPTTDMTGAAIPVLSFHHRYESEALYDFTYVEAVIGGVWTAMNAGYDGAIPWTDLTDYGFDLVGQSVDLPMAQCRFHFISDGAWSDEDFDTYGYNSVGGAYMVDNIRLFDFGAGNYFFDDVEDGVGLCIPGVPASAGDWWHLVDDVCSSNVIPSWWCGDDADTSLIPPGLNNSLLTAGVDISYVNDGTCTMRYAIHAEVPTVDNDYWVNYVVVDMVAYATGAWWGDFAQCSGFGTSGLNGDDVSVLMPGASEVRYMIEFHTTDNGCGPGAAGGAGINVDDTWFEGVPAVAVEETSWGSIKAMYR